MLEEYFAKPATIDRLRGSWIGSEIENYVVWLVDQGYSIKSVWRRVPIVYAFGEFAAARGASVVNELPGHVEAFVTQRVRDHDARTGSARPMSKEVRGPVEQFLSVALPDFDQADGRTTPNLLSRRPRGSSTTWSRSVAYVRPRYGPIDTTWTGSRPTCGGSGSTRSETSPRRS
jgi:integrase/recombinase XerD